MPVGSSRAAKNLIYKILGKLKKMDKAKSATREQAERMLGPRNTTMEMMKRDEMIKHGIKPKD